MVCPCLLSFRRRLHGFLTAARPHRAKRPFHMSTRPPINVDISQRTFYGVSLRSGIILVLTAIPVIAVVFVVGGLPFWLRAGLAILITGLGLSLAFGQINGRMPEAWLLEWVAFRGRPRFFVHRAQKQSPEPAVTFPPQESETEPKPAP